MDKKNDKFFEMNMTIKWRDEEPTSVTYHTGYPDEKIENIIHGFVTCLIGHTFLPSTVIQGLKNYIEEHDLEYSVNNSSYED